MEITIEGKRYRLVPIEEPVKEKLSDIPKAVSPVVSQGVTRAVPKVYEYKERFKRRALLPSDVIAPPRARVPINDMDPDPGGRMSQQAGYSAFYGEGTQIDY